MWEPTGIGIAVDIDDYLKERHMCVFHFIGASKILRLVSPVVLIKVRIAVDNPLAEHY